MELPKLCLVLSTKFGKSAEKTKTCFNMAQLISFFPVY